MNFKDFKKTKVELKTTDKGYEKQYILELYGYEDNEKDFHKEIKSVIIYAKDVHPLYMLKDIDDKYILVLCNTDWFQKDLKPLQKELFEFFINHCVGNPQTHCFCDICDEYVDTSVCKMEDDEVICEECEWKRNKIEQHIQ